MDNLWMIDLVIVACVAMAVFGIMLYYRGKYEKEARFGVVADIWLPNGKSHKELVKPTVDGWVKVGKGHYKLSVGKQYCKCGHEDVEHKMETEGKKKGQMVCTQCECGAFELLRVIPNVRRTTKYPARPFLGLGILQADARVESWFLNNPEPITWGDSRSMVTALDAYVHTREMTAEQTAADIAEKEARQKTWIEAINKIPEKMILYIGLGLADILLIVLVVHTLGLTA